VLSVLQALKSVHFLTGVNEEVLEEIASKCTEKVHLKGETIFTEGDPPRGLIVVREGAVKIFKLGDTGREQILEIEGPGRSVAELPLFDGLPYPASCATVADSVMLTVRVREFHEILDRHPAVGKAIIASLSKRLRRMVMLVQELSLKDVRGRLADLLIEMAGSGDAVEIPFSHQELAARIGTVREIVTRTLGRMAQEGVIRVEGHTIHLLNRDRLKP
jgi:CRP/FNR family transcriptional regulator, cyclic AMP receptor protein